MKPELPLIILALFSLFLFWGIINKNYYQHQERMACIQKPDNEICKKLIK